MPIKQEVRKLFRSWGYDICGYTPISHPLARKKWIIESNGVDTVLDVGANVGQYARHLRHDIDYRRRIISFEPLSSAFRQLQLNAAGDDSWQVFNHALGDSNETQQIHISGNSFSSSLLDMLPSHESAAPGSKYTGSEMIEVKTLDSVFDALCSSSESIYLKIDTQGFESRILRGAEAALARIRVVEMEMSLVPLYQGALEFSDMHKMMKDIGYRLVSLEPAFFDSVSGHLLQVDGMFHRPSPDAAR